MKIYIFETEKWERPSFEPLTREHDLRFVDEPLALENVSHYADAEAISTFIDSRLDGDIIDALPHLKIIASRSTGVDHIDTQTCAQRGIVVCNVPGYGETTVAEHVFGLLLTISHRLKEAIERTQRGNFSPRGLQGFDLRGKTLGVIGTGAIGRETIHIAKGFRMKVLAHDMRPDEQAAREIGFDYVDMDTLLREADIVTLHVPSTPSTRHMISNDEFGKMKDGVVLINTARGDIVDVNALARALVEGKVSAAGLDVLSNEPVIREEAEVLRSVYEKRHDLASLLADEVLVRMRNVVVTPHSAFNTREAVQRILDTTVENLRGFAEGQLQNAVVAA